MYLADILFEAAASPENVTKHGAGVKVDEGVRSTVEVGEADACYEELSGPVVDLAIHRRAVFDEQPHQACDDTWHEADGEHCTDHCYCSNGPPDPLLHVLLLLFVQVAGDSG